MPSYVVLAIFSLRFYKVENLLGDLLLGDNTLELIYHVCQLVFQEIFPFFLLYLHEIDHVPLAYINPREFPLNFSAELLVVLNCSVGLKC